MIETACATTHLKTGFVTLPVWSAELAWLVGRGRETEAAENAGSR